MSFLRNDSGAVTVDWVVLTAGLVGLGLAVVSVISTGVEDLSTDIVDDGLQSSTLISTNFFTRLYNVPDDSILLASFSGEVMRNGEFTDDFVNALADARQGWQDVNAGSYNPDQTTEEWATWALGVWGNRTDDTLISQETQRAAGRDAQLSVSAALSNSIDNHSPTAPTASQLASENGIFSASNWQIILDGAGSAENARNNYSDLAVFEEAERLAVVAILEERGVSY